MGLVLDEPNGTPLETINGISILLDDEVKPYAENQVLDYVTSFSGSGFTISAATGSSCC